MKKLLIALLALSSLLLAACSTSYTSKSKILTSPSSKKFNDARTWTALKGKWYGKQKRVDGQVREWLIEHKADGTFLTTFIDIDKDGKKKTTIEYGDWGASGTVYFTILKGFIKEGEEEPIAEPEYWTRDAYEIIRLNLDEFIYRDLEKQMRFRVIREVSDFELNTPSR
ncbi:hypothetical protein MLD52_20070 [Puniceicoccaceae bacterium K14]|nr:hypothetical protein [Puniceicoccaceae bacterium K14]